MFGQQQNSYWYLASPYTSPDKVIRYNRYGLAEAALAWLLTRRMWTYSPIVHCHAMAERFAMPKDAVFWQDFNHLMISRADGLINLQIEGWQESKGVKEELQFTLELNKPVLHMLPTPDGFVLA